MSTDAEDFRTYEGTAIAVVQFDPDSRSIPPEESFAGLVDGPEETKWSLGMNIIRDLDDEGWVKVAEVDFVADDAPHQLLVRGANFRLFEGPIEIGSVEIRSASELVPPGFTLDADSAEDSPRELAA